MKKSKLLIVDGNFFSHLSYHSKGKGDFSLRHLLPVDALLHMYRLMKGLIFTIKPTHILVVFDPFEGSKVRNKLDEDYKGTRNRGLNVTLKELIREIPSKMGLPTLVSPKHEADDLIASAVMKFKSEFDEVVVASGDGDFVQLLTEDNKNVFFYNHWTKVCHSWENMPIRVKPNQELIILYKALLGDKSDNISGVGLTKAEIEDLLEKTADGKEILDSELLSGYKDLVQKNMALIRFKNGLKISLMKKDLPCHIQFDRVINHLEQQGCKVDKERKRNEPKKEKGSNFGRERSVLTRLLCFPR